MQNRLRKPCNDCPFRRKSLAGWLGSANPEWFISAALSDYGIEAGATSVPAAPCHQTVDYEDPDWEDKLDGSDACVGSLIFARNNGKFPRGEETLELVKSVVVDREGVFATSHEFINHHRQDGGVRSWEGDKCYR